jgi:membrane protein implicated in regulation of membrane protease activity
METIEILWWHWAVLVGALLVIEALGAGGFLLGFALSALLLMLAGLVAVLDWYVQITVFSVLGAVLSFVYVKRFKRFNDETDAPLLNHRMAQLVGRDGVIAEKLGDKSFKVRIGDTLWRAKSSVSMDADQKVSVDAVEGDVLVITPVNG